MKTKILIVAGLILVGAGLVWGFTTMNAADPAPPSQADSTSLPSPTLPVTSPTPILVAVTEAAVTPSPCDALLTMSDAPPSPTPPATDDPLLTMINAIRQQANLVSLNENPVLEHAALDYSQQMAAATEMQEVDGKALGSKLESMGYYTDSYWWSPIEGPAPEALIDYFKGVDEFVPFTTTEYEEVGFAYMEGADGVYYYLLIMAHPMRLTAPYTDASDVGGTGQIEQAEAILELTNRVRCDAGLQPLTLNPNLTAAALEHSRDMAAGDFMAHEGSDNSTPMDRALSAGFQGGGVGENVLQRNNLHAGGAFDQWWNSPGHKENMMQPGFTRVGIAYAESETGKFYYTMLLGQ